MSAGDLRARDLGSRDLGTRGPQLSWHVRLLLGGYPPWWRLRYDDEMRDTVLAMRAAGHWRSRSSLDLLHGLVVAWLDPTTLPSEDSMTDHTGRLIPRSAWGLLLFVLAGSAFAKVIEDPAFSSAAQHHSALTWCVDVLTVAAAATAVVMACCAVPSIVAIVRQRSATVWRDLAPLFVVPVSLAALALTVVVARDVADGTPVHRTSHVIAFLVLVAVTVVAGVASTAALVRVASLAPQGRGVELSRRVAIVAVAVFTAVSALAVAGWLVAAAAESPHLLHTDNGLLATSTLATMVVAMVGLLAAAVLCGTSGLAALSSREAAPRSSH